MIKRFAIALVIVATSTVYAQTKTDIAAQRTADPATSSESITAIENADGSEGLPFASTVQERRVVPQKKAVAADKNRCLVNMACFCDGPLDYYGRCLGSSTCKATQDAFCRYWCDDPMKCATLNENDCQYSCG